MAPLYQGLTQPDWESRIAFFRESHGPCQLCPRRCGADRGNDKPGICQAAQKVKIASFNLHFGEEPPISGYQGSGTIFFSGCTLKCCFCQNYPISQFFNGEYYDISQLADIMLRLQRKGAQNINLVSPTPYLYHFVEVLYAASKRGLNIPIVYNTSGYERINIIENLKGLIDIYMPDFKYYDNKIALQFSGVENYVENARDSISEMFSQVGELVLDGQGRGTRGLLIRHLILPGQVQDSKDVLKTIAEDGLNNSYLSLMSQYFPAYQAADTVINRRIIAEEYREVKQYALELGFAKGWFQDV
jgi:putative pyruvate formate lyase activating enzyme